MKWNDVIGQAINDWSVIEITYGDGAKRKVEPHTYGINLAGHYMLSGYRLSKSNDPLASPDWRSYLDDEIRSVKLTTEHFRQPRTGYNPNPKIFKNVIFKVR